MKQIKSGKVSDTVHLQSDDCVRLVACMADEVATAYDAKAPLKRRLNHEGIDFQFHRRGGVTDFHVHFFYSREFGDNDNVRVAQNGGKDSMLAPVSVPDNETIDIATNVGRKQRLPTVSPTTVQELDSDNSVLVPTVNVNAEFQFNNELCVVTGLDMSQNVVQYRCLLDDTDDECQTMNVDQAAKLVAIQRQLCKLQFIYFHVGEWTVF